jgi:Ca2+/Na+ antiporter
MDPLIIISGGVFFAVLILFSIAYFLNRRHVQMKTIQVLARKLGLFSMIVILFESVLMDHFFAIHAIALISSVALWVIGLIEPSKEAAKSDKQA